MSKRKREDLTTLEGKFSFVLHANNIHAELAAMDRVLNILASRTFYGDEDSSTRTVGGTYSEFGLGYYQASTETLRQIAELSYDGDEGATIAAAIVQAFGVNIPRVIADKFSKKFWENLSRIREDPQSNIELVKLVSDGLAISGLKAKRVLAKYWPRVEQILTSMETIAEGAN